MFAQDTSFALPTVRFGWHSKIWKPLREDVITWVASQVISKYSNDAEQITQKCLWANTFTLTKCGYVPGITGCQRLSAASAQGKTNVNETNNCFQMLSWRKNTVLCLVYGINHLLFSGLCYLLTVKYCAIISSRLLVSTGLSGYRKISFIWEQF